MTKSFLFAFIITSLCFSWPAPTQASQASGVNYLHTQQAADGTIGSRNVTGWAVMALAISGERNQAAIDALRPIQTSLSSASATDIERQILALAAAGENPRTFAAVDATKELNVHTTHKLLDESKYLNDSIFALIAYVSCNIEAPGFIKDIVLSHQSSDGGWSLYVDGQTSSDMTAAALIGLYTTGVHGEAINRGLDYLHAKQNSDGGFSTSDGASNVASTAWAIWALNTLNQSQNDWQKSGHTPQSYLLHEQQTNGSWLNSVLVTSYAVIALSGKSFPIVGTPVPAATAKPAPPTPTPQATPAPSPRSTPIPVTTNASATPVPSRQTPAPSPTTSALTQQSTAATPRVQPTPAPVASHSPALIAPSPTLSPTAVSTHLEVTTATSTPPETLPWHFWLGGLLLSLHTGTTGYHVVRAKKRAQKRV